MLSEDDVDWVVLEGDNRKGTEVCCGEEEEVERRGRFRRNALPVRPFILCDSG